MGGGHFHGLVSSDLDENRTVESSHLKLSTGKVSGGFGSSTGIDGIASTSTMSMPLVIPSVAKHLQAAPIFAAKRMHLTQKDVTHVNKHSVTVCISSI